MLLDMALRQNLFFLEVDPKLTNHVFILFQEFIYLIVYDVKMAIAVIIAGVSATHYASIMAACVSPQTCLLMQCTYTVNF